MNLTGTVWRRKSDDVAIRIEGDAEWTSGRGNRSIRAIDLVSRRSFWVTPEGLARKYLPCGASRMGDVS